MTSDIPRVSMRAPGVASVKVLVLVGTLAGFVLVSTGDGQLYDTNFQTLWEATGLLGGDHPYRDFFEWGLPLQAAVSATAQILSGHRLIGEFLVQWMCIVAGIVISMHLALQLSRSVAASSITIGLAILLLATTATYHYPKLLFYPLALWVAWRYIEKPDTRRGAGLGLTTAVAFLFRHDHGVYIGVLAVVAFGLARAVVPASRHVRAMMAESAAYAAAASIVLLPWLAVVHLNEGVPEYVRARMYLYDDWSTSESPYLSLLDINPVRTVLGNRSVPPRPATVSLTWNANVDAAERAELEAHHRLRPLRTGPDETGMWHYEVPNIYEKELFDLRGSLENADSSKGFDWEQLQRLRAPAFLPTPVAAQLWLYQLALLVPVLLMVSGGFDAARAWSEHRKITLDAARILAAAAFLYAIERSLLREPSYAMALMPVIAALGAPLLRRPHTGSLSHRALRTGWAAARLALVIVLLGVTGLATVAFTRGSGIFDIPERARSVAPILSLLMTSPPIDAHQPAAAAYSYDRDAWKNGTVNQGRLLLRYLHDCTRPEDRILVTGSTPYHVNYYANRRVAGGHLFWHHGWRSDPVRERVLFALLEKQSVPFAFSTTDPVFADLKRYPLFYTHFQKHYVELEGTRGLLLVDTRRTPTSRFGRLGFPCFR